MYMTSLILHQVPGAVPTKSIGLEKDRIFALLYHQGASNKGPLLDFIHL